jgi:integrase
MAGKWERTKFPGVYAQRDLRTGKERYKAAFRNARGIVTSKTFSPRDFKYPLREAKAHLEDMHRAGRENRLPDTSKSRKTMAQLWEHVQTVNRARPSTRAWYESRWTNHVEPRLGGRKVSEVRRSELEELLADVERRTSEQTRRAVQQLVHKLFAVAVRSEWIVKNPADGIDMPPPRPRRVEEPLSQEQVAAIANEVPMRYHALVWTLAVAGLRIGEATALRVKNLDGSIRVVENAPEVRGKKLNGHTKTAGSERVVPIPPSLRQMLHDHVATFANRFDPEALVFTGEHGTQIGQNNFRKRVFQPAAARAKVKPVPTVHDMRHAAASLALSHGLTPYEVAKMLGHADTKMVEKTYGHLYKSAFQAKVDALDALFTSAKTP